MRLFCPNVTIEELSNKLHVNRMRGAIRIIIKTLAASELVKDPEWLQAWRDSVSRRTTSMKNVDSVIKRNNNVRSMLFLCGRAVSSESTEKTGELAKEIIDNGSNYL